jgi:cholesterol oxidase
MCPTSLDDGLEEPEVRALAVFDGSAISANIGLNPSLTVTAQAERATSFWPNKGEADSRPSLGAVYQRIRPVEPLKPVVPANAPAALRLG